MFRIGFLWLLLCLPLGVQAADLSEELFAAARKGDTEAVKVLLQKGVDVNAKTRYGATALHYACDRGHLDLVRLLIERGADVNAKDTFYGITPLNWAITRDHPAVVKLLLEKGAQSKEMAIVNSIDEGHTEVAKTVLEMGGFKGNQLNYYLDMATKKGRSEIADLLKKAGATPSVEYKVEPEALAAYAGVFKSESMELTLSVKDGKLIGGPTGQPPAPLTPTARHTFSVSNMPGLAVVFDLDGEKVIGLTLKHDTGAAQVFKKAETK